MAKLLLFSNRNDCLWPAGTAESVAVSPSNGLDTVQERCIMIRMMLNCYNVQRYGCEMLSISLVGVI